MEKDKFRIKYENGESFKKIEEPKEEKTIENKQNNKNTKRVKLPEWSIEPPLEIKRGK